MKDTLCLHKHFSPLSSSNEFEIQNIIDVYHFVQSFITRHSTPAHTHDVYYLFCAEKATLSLLISIYLSVYGLFTPVCCVVWKVLYKRGKAVSTIHRTTVVLYTCIALGNCWHSPPQSMWQWPGRLATAAVDQLHETCYDWLRGIFGLVGWGTELFP